MTAKPCLVSDSINSLRRIVQATNECSKMIEQETGLTETQLWTIKVIAEAEPIKVSEVARRVHLHPATVVGIIDRLERKCLVVRQRSREDRRIVNVELTERGHHIIARSPKAIQGGLVGHLSILPPKKLQHISAVLEELAAILTTQESRLATH